MCRHALKFFQLIDLGFFKFLFVLCFAFATLDLLAKVPREEACSVFCFATPHENQMGAANAISISHQPLCPIAVKPELRTTAAGCLRHSE